MVYEEAIPLFVVLQCYFGINLLVLHNIEARWKNPPVAWQAAKAQLAIQFEDRFVVSD